MNTKTNSSVLDPVLFKDKVLPSKINTRFWPDLRDIRNHALLALKEIRNSNVDQKVVEEQIRTWFSQQPSDKFFLRLKEDDSPLKNTANSNNSQCLPDFEDDALLFGTENADMYYGNSTKFMYVHQTSWQQRLLLKYGNEISLLDARYRTTKYSLPLYFLCVPTNVNYMCVASFVIETEDQSSIEEALAILKNWNPEWKPQYFMCDYSSEEISALENVFPASFVYLCDFHREQSWCRWLKTSHNGLAKDQEVVLSLLRPIACSFTIEEYHDSLAKLQNSEVWNSNLRLRNWFTRYWLNKPERWVQAYRHNRFNVSVNTNNGVERQNKMLKYEYLQQRKSATLSHLLNVIVEQFLPDKHKRYFKLNLTAFDEYKDYSKEIPCFLHNRPKTVVDTCFQRWIESEHFTMDDIDEIGEGLFLVKSQADNTTMYSTNFNENTFGLPSCTCLSWMRTHLPCKHFFAVFRNYPDWNWDCLPEYYRRNLLLNLDFDTSMNQPSQNCISQNIVSPDIPTCQTQDIDVEKPLPSHAAIRREQQRVISQCQQIKEMIYHCKDISVMSNVAEVLSSAIANLDKAVPKNGPFISEEGNMLHIGTAAKVKKKYTKHMKRLEKKCLPSLPLHRRKKPGSGRYGIKADIKRKMSRIKGVHDIAGIDEGPKVKVVTLDEGALAFKRKMIAQLEINSGTYPSSGLINTGGKNICFANSILQCLRVTEIHRLLQSHVHCQDTSCFTCQLKMFIEEGGDTAEPMLLEMKGIWSEYQIGQQQDAHEFFRKVMQEVYSECLHDQNRNSHSEINHLFYGRQKSKVACINCGACSSHDEIFSDISVSLNEVDSVEGAIRNYFSTQEVQYTCSVCKVSGEAHKSTALDAIPQNLVVQINRFNEANGKICKNIKLAFQIDLQEYASPGITLERRADLFGIVMHYGRTSFSGHYFCFVKFGDHWFRIDDMKIDSVEECDVVNCPQESYLLFYKTFL